MWSIIVTKKCIMWSVIVTEKCIWHKAELAESNLHGMNGYKVILEVAPQSLYDEMFTKVLLFELSSRHCANFVVQALVSHARDQDQFVRALEGDSSLDDLNDGVRPGQSFAFGALNTSTKYSAASYNNDMKKFRQLAFGQPRFYQQ